MLQSAKYLLAVLALSSASSGCVAMFWHETLPATVTITEQATGQPLAGAPVSVGYNYDGYAYLYVYNAPRNAKGMTDANGRVLLPVADYKYGTVLEAAYARVELWPEQVRSGGSFAMQNMGNSNARKPALMLVLERHIE